MRSAAQQKLLCPWAAVCQAPQGSAVGVEQVPLLHAAQRVRQQHEQQGAALCQGLAHWVWADLQQLAHNGPWQADGALRQVSHGIVQYMIWFTSQAASSMGVTAVMPT